MADDRDPQPADDGSAATSETVRFGLDGWVLEVDLDAEGARDLRAVLAPYAAAGRRTAVTVTPVAAPDAAASGTSAAATGERAAARAWLEANGHRIGTRGRISATLMTLYRDRDRDRDDR
jgi:hypothetical protein